MSEQKQKVSDLPENEQKEIIAEAYAVGLKGFNFTSYKVETLKEKIAEAKANFEQQKDEQKGEDSKEQNAQESENEKEVIVAGDGGVHEIPSENEQNAGDDEQEPQNDEQNDSNDEQSGSAAEGESEANPFNADEQANAENVNNDEENKSDESIPEEASDETKAFLNGETDELPEGAEVITEDEAQELEQKVDEPIPGEKLPTKEEPRKVNGICHICGSKVVEGVCTGCGFKKI